MTRRRSYWITIGGMEPLARNSAAQARVILVTGRVGPDIIPNDRQPIVSRVTTGPPWDRSNYVRSRAVLQEMDRMDQTRIVGPGGFGGGGYVLENAGQDHAVAGL